MSDTTFLEYLDDKPQPAPERDKKAISPDNRFMSYIEEESPESLKASQNISAVRDIDPDTEAQHYDLSKKTGIPLSIVRNAPEQVREIDGKPVYTIDDPSLIQKYLGKNHTNAAISKDDIPGLEKVQKTFLEKVKESYRRGMHNVELGNLKANQLFGDTSEATERRIQEIKAEQAGGIPTDLKDLTVQRKKLSEIVAEKEALQPEGFVEKGILGAVEQAPIYLDTLSKGLERGLLGASVGAGTAVIAGQLGPQVATPEEIFTVPIFAGGGFGIGFKAGSAEAIFKLESGLAAVEFESFRDENGDPLDPGIIWSASIAVGLVNAGFEFASLSVLLKTIPGGEKLLSRFTGKEVSQVLKNPTVRKKLADIAVKYSKAVAFESLTEAAQEAVTIIGGELAKSAGEATGSGFFDKIDINDASKRVLESGIAAIGPTLIFGAPGSMVSVYNAISNVHDSNDFVANLDKDKTALDETLTAQRSKDHAKQIAETIGGRTEEVYISSEFFQTHTNEQAADILKKISVDPEKAREAVTTGEDISVKVSAILTLEQDEYDTLKDDIKPAPGAYTQREIQAQKANEDIENSINLLKEETEKSKQVDAEIERLQGEVQKTKLPDPKLAEDAPILLKGLANRLSLEGIDPVEFLKKISIKKERFVAAKNLIERGKRFFQGKRDPVQLPAELKTAPIPEGDANVDLFSSLERMQALELKLRAYDVVPGRDSTVELFKEETREELDILTDDISNIIRNNYDEWLSFHETPEGWISEILDVDNELGLFSKPSEAFKDGVVGVLEGTKIWSVDIEQEILDRVNEEFAPEELPDNIEELLTELEDFGETREDLTEEFGIGELDEDDVRFDLQDRLRERREETATRFTLFEELNSGEELGELLDQLGWESEAGEIVIEMMQTRGYEQWKSAIGRDVLTDVIETIREQRDRLDAATDVNEKVVAINVALNVEHVTGTMGERLDISQDELDALAAMGDKVKDLRDLVSPERKRLFQTREDRPTTPKGAVTITDEKTLIQLYENADLSTVLHEVGHIALLEYSNLERSGQASTLLKQDMGIIRKWVGAKEGADLTRDQSEQFARGFEAYLMEGKAPTPELRTAFERFKQWLIQTYKTVKSLNVKLDRNVRGVFDRMLSANIEVEAAAAQNGFIIKTTDEMNVLGIRKEDQVYAKNLIDTATKKAERRLTQTRNKGIRQNRINWRAEAVSELKQENPVYGIIDDIIKSAGKGKYNVEELESIRRDIELSDAGFRMPKDDFYSEDWTGVDSTFPEYFKKINEAIKKKKEKGEKRKAPLSKSNTIGAFKKNAKGETYWRKGPIDKAIAGESLTEDQQAIVDMLVEGYRDQTARLIEAAGSEISPEFFATGDLRFDRKEFVERYGEDAIDRLPNKGIMINDGIPIDETALLYEYENSYEFINDLFSTPKFSEAVDQRVNEKQIAHDSQWRAEDFLVDLKEYRDYLDLIARYVNSQTVDQATIEKSINTNIPRWRKEAQAEISNEAPDLTGDALEEAINTRVEEKTNAFRVRKAKPSAITTASLKRLAKETMNAKTVREAQRVDKFLAAAKKAASDGRRAILRKDWGEASRSSEIERFNYEMAGLAVKIRNEVTAAQNYAKKVGKPKKKETIGFEHKEAILHLISRYNLASLVPREPQSLPDYTSLFAGDDFGNQGFPDPEFLKNGGINDFRDLRIEQLRELDNAIHYLAGKGRIEKSEFLTDSEVSFEEVNNGAVSNLKKLKPLKKWEKGSMMRRLSDMTRSFFARLDGLTFIAKSVDGYTNLGKDGVKGPMEIYIIDRIKRKMNERDIRKGEITAQFEPHLKQIQKTNRKWRKRFGSYIKIEGVPLPQRLIDDGQTKGWKDYQIWGVILNTGNIGEKSNMENLLSGYPDLTPGMIETMKNLLSIEDMQAIQGIWDTIDTLFKDADAQFLKDNNYHMPKVEATPFIFKGETFRGGYYPISHDKNLSYKVADRGQIEDFFTQEAGKISVPYTKKNFTIQRQSGVALPIRLDLSGIDKHIRDTLNYIYLSDVIRDADKITRNEEFRDAVTRVLGKDVYDAIRPALQHIANPVKEGLDQPGSQLIERMRGLATLYNLAWNTGVAIKQPLSTFGAIRDMGFVPYLKGMGSVLGSPPAHYQQMIELSVYMKERMSFFDRELRSQFLKLTAEQKGIYFGDSKITWEDVKYFGFWQIRLADTITVLPIWHGAFQDKLLADQSNLQEAIEYADDIVRNSQPSAQPLDLSSWQRDGGAIRLLSMFQTFTVGKYGQRQRLFYRAWKNGAISTQQYAWFNFMDGIAPLIALNMVQSLLWGRDFDEETLEEIVKNVLAGWATMGIPIAGNIARSMTTGYGDAFDSPILETGNKLLNDGFKGIKGMAFFKNEKEREKALWAIAHTISILSGVPLDKIVAKAQKGAKQKKGVPVIKYLVPAPKKRR